MTMSRASWRHCLRALPEFVEKPATNASFHKNRGRFSKINNMLNYIEKLRQKPEKTKTFIAFSASLFFAGTILLIWITVVFPDIRQDQAVKDRIASIEPSPFSAFFGNIANGFSGIKNQFDNTKEKITAAVVFTSTTTTESKSSDSVNPPVEFVEVTATSTESTATSTAKIGE